MKLAMFVNDYMTEEVGYTTNRLAMAAINQGHEVWTISADCLKYDGDDSIKALARKAPKNIYKTNETYLKDLQDKKTKPEEIVVDELDVLFLRSDPALETGQRAWAQSVGINFGRLTMQRGVIVVNDPNGLSKAINKMYFQTFPEHARPRTIITRDKKAIKEFAKEAQARIVLKPLQGSRGQGVFFLEKGESKNLNQIVDALTADGYLIAQEYIPDATTGNTRLFLLNGEPLQYKGKYGVYRRVFSPSDDGRGVHVGTTFEQTEVTDSMLSLLEIVRPKLVQDGMFFVGLDIVGAKLMGINVFSPGGLGTAQKLEGVDFAHAVIEALERKVDCHKNYHREFDNVDLCTL
ncbi:MAG: glutathione synthase [Cyanobacteria bacterium]|nr:glutathione synthase [Cyanobacteriota bacterium]